MSCWCCVPSDTWCTAYLICCWSSWFLKYLKKTSKEACCKHSARTQRSYWPEETHVNPPSIILARLIYNSQQCEADIMFCTESEGLILVTLTPVHWDLCLIMCWCSDIRYDVLEHGVLDTHYIWNRCDYMRAPGVCLISQCTVQI